MIEPVEVRRFERRADARLPALVLAAAGIEFQVLVEGGAVKLCVSPGDVERAELELGLYERENRPEPRSAGESRSFGSGIDAALVFCAILLFFFALDHHRLGSLDWAAIGAAQAGLIRDGAWWRAITSLTLHVDADHLIGNLGFGTAFGLMAAQLLGPGLAWLAILVSGAAGNALNAFVQAPDHTAVGASTALFGALGILSGYVRRSQLVPWRGGIRRWAPISAGILMLVFVGTGGERTDVGAHVAGFLVGCGLGLALGQWGHRLAQGPRAQWAYGLGALAAIVVAWLRAVAAAG